MRVEQDEQMTRIDMRSKSREGLVDGGYNAKRIRAFMLALSKTLDEKVRRSMPDDISDRQRNSALVEQSPQTNPSKPLIDMAISYPVASNPETSKSAGK